MRVLVEFQTQADTGFDAGLDECGPALAVIVDDSLFGRGSGIGAEWYDGNEWSSAMHRL